MNGNAEVVKVLVDSGRINLHVKYDGLAPLDMAIEYGHAEVVRILACSGQVDLDDQK